jgi:hypothetical protein
LTHCDLFVGSSFDEQVYAADFAFQVQKTHGRGDKSRPSRFAGPRRARVVGRVVSEGVDFGVDYTKQVGVRALKNAFNPASCLSEHSKCYQVCYQSAPETVFSGCPDRLQDLPDLGSPAGLREDDHTLALSAVSIIPGELGAEAHLPDPGPAAGRRQDARFSGLAFGPGNRRGSRMPIDPPARPCRRIGRSPTAAAVGLLCFQLRFRPPGEFVLRGGTPADSGVPGPKTFKGLRERIFIFRPSHLIEKPSAKRRRGASCNNVTGCHGGVTGCL